jgi:hypothetical protein
MQGTRAVGWFVGRIVAQTFQSWSREKTFAETKQADHVKVAVVNETGANVLSAAANENKGGAWAA